MKTCGWTVIIVGVDIRNIQVWDCCWIWMYSLVSSNQGQHLHGKKTDHMESVCKPAAEPYIMCIVTALKVGWFNYLVRPNTWASSFAWTWLNTRQATWSAVVLECMWNNHVSYIAVAKIWSEYLQCWTIQAMILIWVCLCSFYSRSPTCSKVLHHMYTWLLISCNQICNDAHTGNAMTTCSPYIVCRFGPQICPDV